MKTFSSSLQCGCTKRKTEIREENPLHMCNIMCKQFFIKACAISFSFSLSFLNSLQILTSLDKQFHSSFIVFSTKVTDTCTPTLSVCLGRNGEMICLTHRMRWKEFATAGQHVKRSRKERREKQRERKTQKRLWGVLLICVIFSTFLFCDQSNRLTHSFWLSVRFSLQGVSVMATPRGRSNPCACPTKASCLQDAPSRDSPVSVLLCSTFMLAVSSALLRWLAASFWYVCVKFLAVHCRSYIWPWLISSTCTWLTNGTNSCFVLNKHN